MTNNSFMCQSISMPKTKLPVCQSCSIIMNDKLKYGTEIGGTLSKEYCVYCYKDGSFTYPNVTLEEIVEMYAPQWGAWIGKPQMTVDEAKVDLRNTLLTLKRWRK